MDYFLVLERRPGDFNIIDINILDICEKKVGNSLGDIDNFTCQFTESEIKESILRCNIVPLEYLAGELKVVSTLHHNLRALTREMYDGIVGAINSSEPFSNDLKNKLICAYKSALSVCCDDENRFSKYLKKFKEAKDNNENDLLFSYINMLPYPRVRNIYLMVYDELLKNKQDVNRLREKVSD